MTNSHISCCRNIIEGEQVIFNWITQLLGVVNSDFIRKLSRKQIFEKSAVVFTFDNIGKEAKI